MDFRLTSQQLELQAIARDFAATHIRPRAQELDRISNPEDAWPCDLFAEASRRGLRTLKLPREYGGFDADTLTELIVLEELCVGDVAFGSILAHPWREGLILAQATNETQRQKFLMPFLDDEDAMTSIGITEPHAGSDNSSGYDLKLSAGPQTRAVRDGEDWVLNGHKIFITAGNVARFMLVIARTNPKVPWRQGISVFYVPTDTPGYECIQVMDKLGMRPNPNTEVVLTDCHIPYDYLIGEIDRGIDILAKYGASSKVKEGVKALGCARAAYEEAVKWCEMRVQGGQEIISHQVVSHRLASMASEVELCRSLCWRAGWSVDHDSAAGVPLQTMAKIQTCEMAVRVCVQALELLGGYGVLKENPMEKFVRDAVTMLHTTGGSDGLRDGLANLLYSSGQKS
jgi:alkylation response protein AidB-like acyl-CoA dehydrogenase